MQMLLLYRCLLKLPYFRGRDRLIQQFRRRFLMPETASLVHGLKFEPDPIEWTQSELIRDGLTEPLTAAVYAKILRPGDVYVDVGAHVGFHTLLARYYTGPTGRVIAVEPQPYNAGKVLANWSANGFTNIVLYVAAAGDTEGVVTLQAQKNTDTARLSLESVGVSDDQQQFRVPMRRLDRMLVEQMVDRVRLLKIDVEGFELAVVNGIGDWLYRIDYLLIELLDAGSTASKKTAAVIARLRHTRFDLCTVGMKSWDERTPLPENNLLAIKSRNPE